MTKTKKTQQTGFGYYTWTAELQISADYLRDALFDQALTIDQFNTFAQMNGTQ